MVGELYSNHILYIYIHIYIISSFRHRFVSHAISPLESRFIWVQEMVQFSVHPKTLIPWQFQFSPWKLVMGKLARLYSMDCFLRLKSLENSSIFHPYFIHMSSIFHPYIIHISSIFHLGKCWKIRRQFPILRHPQHLQGQEPLVTLLAGTRGCLGGGDAVFFFYWMKITVDT